MQLENISKSFGKKPVLNNISLEVKEGEIVGFLGLNGAGKTTLMRILTTYLPLTTGQGKIFGHDLQEDHRAITRHIGYLPEQPVFYPEMSVGDYLSFMGQLRGIPKNRIQKAMTAALETCQLEDVRGKNIAILSKGYKQRVGLAQAIIHDPKLLILDEPTSGLDPCQISRVRELIRQCSKTKTIILSTHVLSEIDQLVNRVLILHGGAIRVDTPISQIARQAAHTPTLTIDLKSAQPISADLFLKFSETKFSISGSAPAYRLTATPMPLGQIRNEILKTIFQAGGHIIEVHESRPTLEELFFKIVTNETLTTG